MNWLKRTKNALAMLAIGDGVMQIVAPERHERLWTLGPEWLREAKGARWFAEHRPGYARVVGAVQVGAGVWLALRQYREG